MKRHQVNTKHPRYKVPNYPRGQEQGEHPPETGTEEYLPVNQLVKQLSAMDRMYQYRYGVRNLINMGNDTLRLATKQGRSNAVNVDIKYNSGSDLYDITAYEINRNMQVKKVYEGDGFYTENLPTVLNSIIIRKDYNRDVVVSEGLDMNLSKADRAYLKKMARRKRG